MQFEIWRRYDNVKLHAHAVELTLNMQLNDNIDQWYFYVTKAENIGKMLKPLSAFN
jgi:hypothetical protein